MINFKNFKIQELKDFDTEVRIIKIEPELEDKYKNVTFNIGDHIHMEISKGSENIYLDFKAYHETDDGNYSEHIIRVLSKDNHIKLKELALNLILQS